jgi:hypothetical protein
MEGIVLTADKSEPLSLQWYYSEPKGDEYLLYALPMWAQAYRARQDFTLEDIKKWVTKLVDEDIKKGYVTIKTATYDKVIFAFNVKKFIYDNFFRDAKVQFHLPRTLEWTFKKSFPLSVLAHCSWNMLGKFIAIKFKEFLRTNQRSIFRDKMKIMKRVNYDWFDYDCDIQANKIWVKMKITIMMGLAIATYGIYKVAKDIL